MKKLLSDVASVKRLKALNEGKPILNYLLGISSVTIPVRNVESAGSWYRSNLGGVPSVYSMDGYSPLEFDAFECPVVELIKVEDDARLRLTNPGTGKPMGTFSFVVRNAKETFRLLKDRGVNVFEPYEDEDGKMIFVFEDLDGNYLSITDMA